MALRKAGQHCDPVGKRSSSEAFAATAQSLRPSALQNRLEALQLKTGQYSKIDNGQLVIPLHTSHMLFGQTLVSALKEDPELERHIVFRDGGTIRPCSDVVFDLETRGLELARLLYLETQPVTRIVITPPVRGYIADMPDIISCRPLQVSGRDGKEITLHTDIRTEGDFWSPQKKKNAERHIIQSNNISLQTLADDLSILKLQISTRTGMSSEYKVKQPDATHHDFSFN